MRRCLDAARCANEALIVGLSGGPDSTALLEALARVAPERGLRLVAAHLDHRLRRGSKTETDACRELCSTLSVRLRVASRDVRARARRDKEGIEQAARHERYAFLRRVAAAEGARFIAVAHTQDDQAETVLLRLLRGAGSTGLGAMRAVAGDILRPFLGRAKADVLRYLSKRGRRYVTDPSNEALDFERNRVRHQLLPAMAEFNPRIREALAQTASLLADEDEALGQAALALFPEEAAGGSTALAIGVLRDRPRAIARRLVREAVRRSGGLRGVGFRHIEDILALSRSPSPSGRRIALPGGRAAVFSFGTLTIARTNPPRPRIARATLCVPGRVEVAGYGTIQAARSRGAVRVAEREAVVAVPKDAPLVVRGRLSGDRVFWRGRRISLKRFLMSHGVPADDRGHLLLVARDDTVVWIANGPPVGSDPAGGRAVRLKIVKGRGAQMRVTKRRATSLEARPR